MTYRWHENHDGTDIPAACRQAGREADEDDAEDDGDET